MPRLWLTYAWKDNDDQDVDHVVGELKKVGLDVGFDRAHLIPGQRLWPQIDKAISDPKTDGWAILATANSFSSKPCLEELAYALDRALRTRGGDFPLIGIFPAPLDRAIVPSAIAMRLHVTLQQPNWARLVAAGVERKQPTAAAASVAPFVARFHQLDGKPVLELRPRSGRWYPALVAVPKNGSLKISAIMPGPSGRATLTGMVRKGAGDSADGQWSCEVVHHAIDALNSLYVAFDGVPTGQILRGDADGEKYLLNLDAVTR